jgi:hypothetical protein
VDSLTLLGYDSWDAEEIALAAWRLLQHRSAIQTWTRLVGARYVARFHDLRGRRYDIGIEFRQRVDVRKQLDKLLGEAVDFFVGQCDAR